MEEENINEYYLKTKKLQKPKLKDLYKYYQDQDSSQLLEDISPSTRQKIFKKHKGEQRIKYENSKNRYNQESINNKEKNSLQKNKSCPKFNNINSDDLTINKSNDEQFYNFYNKNENINNYYLNNNTELTNYNTPENTYKKKKIQKNNYDYIVDNNIFTRIVPNFENKLNEDKSGSQIQSINDSLYNNKTYDIHYMKKIPKKSNFIYYKSKTPNKKCIFYNKKKKIRNSNNLNKSLYSEINNSSMDNNINVSINDENFSSSKRSDTSRKLSLLLKYGVNFDLNKDKKNDYIDLLTISDIENMKNQKKLNKLSLQKNNQKNINIINYTVIPNLISSSNTNSSNAIDKMPYYNNKIYPNRNNKFLEQRKKIGKKYDNKSYDCIVFKKKIGMNKKKKKSKRNKTSDIFNDKGTPIKKENDRGGIVVLYPNRIKNNKYKNIKTNNLKEKQKFIESDIENDSIIETKKIVIAVTIIQKWWKKTNYRFIKKIIIIQKIFRGYHYRKEISKILEAKSRLDKIIEKSKTTIVHKNNIQNNKFYNSLIYKKHQPRILFISKDYYNMPSHEIILIQERFRDFLKFKKNNINKDNKNDNSKEKNNISLNNMVIRKNKNNLKIIQSNKNKGHRYTQSKLFKSDINNILLSGSQNKYETKNYTFYKICNFKDQPKEEENNEERTRPYSYEIMRKIKYNRDKRQLTPDVIRSNIRNNPNLRIIKVNNDQYFNNNKNQNKYKFSNEARKNNFNRNNNINEDNSNKNNNLNETNRTNKFYKYYKNKIENQKINNNKSKKSNNNINDYNNKNFRNIKIIDNLGNNNKNIDDEKNNFNNYNHYLKDMNDKMNKYYNINDNNKNKNIVNDYIKTKNNNQISGKLTENTNNKKSYKNNDTNSYNHSIEKNKKSNLDNDIIIDINYNNTSFIESKNYKRKPINNINYNDLNNKLTTNDNISDNHKVYNSKYSKKKSSNIIDKNDNNKIVDKKDNNFSDKNDENKTVDKNDDKFAEKNDNIIFDKIDYNKTIDQNDNNIFDKNDNNIIDKNDNHMTVDKNVNNTIDKNNNYMMNTDKNYNNNITDKNDKNLIDKTNNIIIEKNDNNISDINDNNIADKYGNNITDTNDNNNIADKNDNNIIDTNDNKIADKNNNNIIDANDNNIIDQNDNNKITDTKDNNIIDKNDYNIIADKNDNNIIDKNNNKISNKNDNNIIDNNDNHNISDTNDNNIIDKNNYNIIDDKNDNNNIADKNDNNMTYSNDNNNIIYKEKNKNNNNSYDKNINLKSEKSDRENISNYKPIQIITQFQMNEIIIKKNPDNYIYSKKIPKKNKDEEFDKIIFIQKNVRKFLEKLKPKIKNTKKTVLKMNNNKENIIDNSENISQNNSNSETNQPKYYNNNAVYIDKENKTNLSRAELREKKEISPKSIKNSPKSPEKNIINYNINNNNSQLENNLNYSPNDENNSIPNQNYDINNSKCKIDSLKEYSDSLKTISVHNDNLESKIINDSLVNNSLINKNSITSINNNIKNYIINKNSINDSFSEQSHSNLIKEDNNIYISSNLQQDTTTTKRRKTSSSLKSLKYKYNKNSYKEYLQYLLKDNYMNYIINQLKYIGNYMKYYNLIYILKMLEQRIVKVMHQFVFFIIKGNGFIIKKNIFFNILIKYIQNENIFINDNNDLTKLFQNNILYYYNVYNKYNFIPYIRPDDEKQLVNTQLFNNDIDFNNLISFICKYLKIEKKLDDISPELVKYYLMKRPLKNFNIFSLTRYMNSLHYIIIFNSYNTNNIVNKDKQYKTYCNIIKNSIFNSNNSIFNRDIPTRSLSLDDNKYYNLRKKNTFYLMKKKIGLNRDNLLKLGNSTYDINSFNLMNNKRIDNLINKEIVSQIYEDYYNNKKYMKRRSVNYERTNKFKLKRHVAKLSSSNIGFAPFGNVQKPNNSLVKMKFIYMKRYDL